MAEYKYKFLEPENLRLSDQNIHVDLSPALKELQDCLRSEAIVLDRVIIEKCLEAWCRINGFLPETSGTVCAISFYSRAKFEKIYKTYNSLEYGEQNLLHHIDEMLGYVPELVNEPVYVNGRMVILFRELTTFMEDLIKFAVIDNVVELVEDFQIEDRVYPLERQASYIFHTSYPGYPTISGPHNLTLYALPNFFNNGEFSAFCIYSDILNFYNNPHMGISYPDTISIMVNSAANAGFLSIISIAHNVYQFDFKANEVITMNSIEDIKEDKPKEKPVVRFIPEDEEQTRADMTAEMLELESKSDRTLLDNERLLWIKKSLGLVPAYQPTEPHKEPIDLNIGGSAQQDS